MGKMGSTDISDGEGIIPDVGQLVVGLMVR
jgi:hypothetical protein